MTAPLLGAALCLVALGVLVAAEVRQQPTVRAVAKASASAAFLLTALTAGITGSAGTAIFSGLVLGALGDLLLLSHDKRWFLAGLVAFLLNHVAYGVAFVILGIDPTIAAIAVVPLLLIAAGVWKWLGPHTGKLKVPVIAYVVVITGMVALAAATQRPLLLLGAMLFFTSDLAVARHRFILKSSNNKVIGLPLYYVGQLVFALSVASG